MPSSSNSDLRRRRSSKNRWSTTSSTAVGPQPIADPEWEPLGHDRPLDAEGRHHLREQRRKELVGIQPRGEELLDGKRLSRDQIDRVISECDAIALDAPDDRDPPAVDLRVDEWVADVDGNLVPKLRQTERVADQEDIWHRV